MQGRLDGIASVVYNIHPQQNEISGIWHAGYQRGLEQTNFVEEMGYEKGFSQGFQKGTNENMKAIQTILKSGDMDAITKELGKTFKGFAEQEANTVEGQFRRIGIAVNEAKESLGAALLPILEKIAGFVNTEVVPAIQGLVDGLTGQKSIRQATLDAGGNVNLLKDDLNDANESGRNL
jgi:hypothetical protein